MNQKFYVLPLNLSQVLIHTGETSVINTVAAVYSVNKRLLVLLSEYSYQRDAIIDALTLSTGLEKSELIADILVGSSFRIDTWNELIRNYNG